MAITKSDTVKSIITQNLHSAAIFNAYGIDFYYYADKTLEDVCVEEGVSIEFILEELWEMVSRANQLPDFNTMSIDMLAHYIEKTHHRYTERKVVLIRNNIQRLLRQDKEHQHELSFLSKTFEELAIHLRIHMKQEEFIIFPYIKRMVKRANASSPIFRSISDPISAMTDDHEQERKIFNSLAKHTRQFTAPDGYYAYKVTYNAMKELEHDLRVHMHLENNVLFPKAIDFERQLKVNFN